MAYPTRTLANALINASWRNGPVESIHTGPWGTFPLLQRRVTVREEQPLMRTTASRLAQGLLAFLHTMQARHGPGQNGSCPMLLPARSW
jgi:hypothetical protein